MSEGMFVLWVVSVVLGCHAIWYGIIEFLRERREDRIAEEEHRAYKLVSKFLEPWQGSMQGIFNDIESLNNKVKRLEGSIQVYEQKKGSKNEKSS